MTRPPRRQSRLADEHPAYPTPVAVPEPQPQPQPENLPSETRASAAADTAGTAVPMPPPRRRRQTREQLNTRINVDLHARLQRFVTEHDAAVQDVVETALVEYLDLRGG